MDASASPGVIDPVSTTTTAPNEHHLPDPEVDAPDPPNSDQDEDDDENDKRYKCAHGIIGR